jgi:Mlc titration factor MtfA (ptsG expression regulator)
MASHILLITAVLAGALVAGAIFDRIRRASRLKTVRAVGFPFHWLPLIERGLSVYRTLPFDLRERVQEMAFFKINDLHFDGLGPFQDVSDEIKVSLGAHVGLLHVNVRIPPIPLVRSIVVGPEAMILESLRANPEAWGDSTLVTVWDTEAHAARSIREELNPEVVRQWKRLAPPNDGRLFFAGWARSLHYDSPKGRARAAEFAPEVAADSLLFAAASEAFIRFPEFLARNSPDTYNALRAFYRFDPARWNRQAHTESARPAVASSAQF